MIFHSVCFPIKTDIKADEAKINLNLTDWEKTLPSYLEYQEIALDATKLAQVVKEFYCESLNQTACLIVNGTTVGILLPRRL